MIPAVRAAVFLDRDGVLIEDRGLVVDAAGVHVAEGAPAATARLRAAGFELVVVSNQAVVARGLVSEEGVEELNRVVARRIAEAGGAEIDAFYTCPHHPNADVERYRVACDCRKPEAGLLVRAASDLELDLRRSFMVGDRPTDVAAGRRAGCRTVLVRTGQHDAPPIETAAPFAPDARPDHVCDDVPAAADWILTVSA